MKQKIFVLITIALMIIVLFTAARVNEKNRIMDLSDASPTGQIKNDPVFERINNPPDESEDRTSNQKSEGIPQESTEKRFFESPPGADDDTEVDRLDPVNIGEPNYDFSEPMYDPITENPCPSAQAPPESPFEEISGAIYDVPYSAQALSIITKQDGDKSGNSQPGFTGQTAPGKPHETGSGADEGESDKSSSKPDLDNSFGPAGALNSLSSSSITNSEVKLKPNDGAAGDRFGETISIDGDTAVIGAIWDDDNGTDSGSAYVFVRSGTGWTQQAKILAGDGAAGDTFGISVAVSGNTALVGAYLDDDKGSNSGSVYVFVRSGTSWTQQAKLTAGDGATDDWFGVRVALDGDRALIGANKDDDKGTDSGSAYIFERTGTSWTQKVKITPGDGAAGDEFGIAVALDGNTASIGARNDDDQGADSGSAYVFTVSGTGWTQQAKLTDSGGASYDHLGESLSLSGDTVVMGAWGDDDKGTASGSAVVFVRSGTSWTQQAKLLAADGADRDYFGYSVGIDGDTAVVGAFMDDDNGDMSGSAYLFVRSGTSWTQKVKLNASDGDLYDFYGLFVAIDGNTAMIGSPCDDDNGVNSGSVYVYEWQADLNATIDLDPDTLNLKSKGRWITCYISLPDGYDIKDIDITSILLNDNIPVAKGVVADDVLMVKFDRKKVQDAIGSQRGDVELKVTGELEDGSKFSGSDTIRIKK